MIKKLVVMFAVMIAVTSISYAQQLKLGYVNSDELLSLMPAVQKVNTEMETYMKALDETYKGMTTEYEKKVAEYQKNVDLWPPITKESKEKEIVSTQQRISEFEQSIQDDVSKKEQQLMTPIIQSANDAIQAVAKEGSYTYIFDASMSKGSILFAADSENILPKVKAKLGL